MKRCILAITGASGAAYGRRLLEVLAATRGMETHLVVSRCGGLVLKEELGVDWSPSAAGVAALLGRKKPPKSVVAHAADDLAAPLSSGSFRTEGMAVCPASMGRVGRLAGGLSLDLVDRAAEVTLKEQRRLVIVPRETPVSAIHLENMARLARAGAVVLPAMPGFYGKPKRVEDLVDFIVARVLDHLGVANSLAKRWKEKRRK